MSAAESISSALKNFGRPMVLRRGLVSGTGEVTVYGTTDGAMISRLVGSVVQSESHVIFSDAEILAATWPGPPKINDQMVIDGKTKTIDAYEPKFLGTVLLVHLCRVKG
ncbi:MAG TPA: hypothetical protein VHZ78_08580 [Rhizomicrobium sp.]|jgi:hypothetical protein|nr:hypothetical protein [Rhizomicrobium sp.]